VGTRAVIYCRISLDATGEGLGVARQEEACRDLCERRGWDVAEVVVDNSVSASTGKRRPGWSKVLDLIGQGSVEVVVAWQVDRMYRSLRDLEDLVDLSERTGITLATVSGDLDLSTPSGRFLARILGSAARQEVEIKSVRQKAAHYQRSQAGKPWWNSRPFGFERDGTHREEEATALRLAYTDVLNGTSIYSVAVRWNKAGILTPRGNKWRSSNLRHVLMSERNAAIHTYNGDETGHAATWEPIVSEDVYRATSRLLSDPARSPGGGGRRKGLLTGVVECSKCGGKVLQGMSRANKAGERYRIYACRNGRCISIPAEWLESYVLRKVIDFADQWRSTLSAPEDTDGEVAALRAEGVALQERKQGLAELYAGQVIDGAALAAGTAKANARLAEITERLAGIATARAGIDLGDLEGLWTMVDEMDTDRARSIIEAVTESIRLLPRGKGARLPKAEHVEITWRKPKAPGRELSPNVALPADVAAMWDEAESEVGTVPSSLELTFTD
jgi:site-specific DNA recombinase